MLLPRASSRPSPRPERPSARPSPWLSRLRRLLRAANDWTCDLPSLARKAQIKQEKAYDTVAKAVADAGGDNLPPFDVPGAASATKAAAVAPAASANDDVPAAPWESNPGAGSPFGHQGAAPSIPQTEDEAKALIRSVFGQSTIFKPVE